MADMPDLSRQPITNVEIESRVYPHAGKDVDGNDVLSRITDLRAEFEKWMRVLRDELPEGRYKTLALTELEMTQVWANKALAQSAPVVVNY